MRIIFLFIMGWVAAGCTTCPILPCASGASENSACMCVGGSTPRPDGSTDSRKKNGSTDAESGDATPGG